MATNILNLGRVVGNDGFSPVVAVAENTLESYRIRIEAKDNAILTPNLRGAAFKTATVDVFGEEPVIIPFSALGLNPARSYTFFADANIEYPLLRNIAAVRVGNAVRITIFTDTLPYTEPQTGSPFLAGIRKFGERGLVFGSFSFGTGVDGKSFPVKLLCLENPVNVITA